MMKRPFPWTSKLFRSRSAENDYNEPGNGTINKKIADFFTDTDSPSRLLSNFIIATYLTATVTAATYIGLTSVLPDGNPGKYALMGLGYSSLKLITSIVGFLSAVSTSLAASFIAIHRVNKATQDRVQFVKSLGHRGVMESVMLILSEYGGRYNEDKYIELIFEKLASSSNGSKVLICRLIINQRMHLTRSSFSLVLEKLNRSETAVTKISLLDPDVPDDLMSLDITDIKRFFPDEEASLGVTEIMIESLPQTTSVSVSGHRTKWTVDTRKFIGGGLKNVHYEYKIAFEAPGHTFFNVTEPTKGFTCKIDISRVHDKISVYAIEMLNATTFGHDVTIKEKIVLATDKWIIPKSSVVFCWYLRAQVADPIGEVGPRSQAMPHTVEPK